MKYFSLIIDLLLLILSICLIIFDYNFFNLPVMILILIYIYSLYTVIPSVFPFFNKRLMQGRHFKKNYQKKDYNYQILQDKIKKDNKKAKLSLIIWLVGLAIFSILYLSFDFFNENYIFLAYSIILICEWICLYIYCVFKNIIKTGECCSSCRIKNYDNFFRFSLFILIPNFFTYSLFFLGVFSIIEWEYLYKKYPERFYKETNKNINCLYCKTKNINCIK